MSAASAEPNQRILGFRPPPPDSEAVPSGINGNLRPELKSLDIFPAHVAGDSSDRRHWLADIQRRVLWGMKAGIVFKSLSDCMARPIPAGGVRKDETVYETGAPGKIQLHKYGDAENQYGFAWAQHCSNALLCFTCAPKIRFKRAGEVKRAAMWAISEGMAAIMITFTAPHYADSDPRRQVDGFMVAKRLFKSGRWWQEQRAKIGYKHSIRALEVTLTHPRYGIGNGAHVHDHGLYFCEHPAFCEAEAAALLADWLPRWRDCLLKAGIEIRDMDAFMRHGIKISLPHARGRVVDDAALTAMAEYVADKMAVEISPGIFSKTGRDGDEKSKHINHFEFFALALTKYKECRPYMLRLMLGLKGRAWMQWSRGLKSAAGIEEKSDDDLMRENGGECLKEYDTEKEWYFVNNRKLQRRYARAMVADGGEPKETAERMMRIIKAGYDPLTGEAFDDAVGVQEAV